MNTVQLAKRFERDDWGGAETVVLETSKRLLALGHGAEVFCSLDPGRNLEEIIDGVKVRRFPYFYPNIGLSATARDALHRKGGSPFSFELMRALASRPGTDLIHLHTMGRFGGMGRRVAQKRRIPYVVSLHGGYFDVPAEESNSWRQASANTIDWGKPLGWWVGARRVLADASAILCVGYPESRLAQERFPEKRVIYSPNGVDSKRFSAGDRKGFRHKYGIAGNACVLLTVARIDSQKNQLMLVESLPQLRETCGDIHLVLIGPLTNAGYAESIKNSIRRSGLENAVTFIPGLPVGSQALVDAYHGADVFVLPSIHEPFGIVILEAWAAGLPVIASNVGGIPHFVSNDEDGILFDPKSPSELISTFTRLIGNPELMRKIAAEGAEKARSRYSWDAVSEQLAKIYTELIDENPFRS